MNPIGYHVTNLAIHLAGVTAAWLLARQLGLSWWSSLVAAAVFALHPLVVASVPVIARRDSIMPVAAFHGRGGKSARRIAHAVAALSDCRSWQAPCWWLHC